VYINGAPMPALYNDELYIETLQKHYDTTVEDARNYAIIGCVEPNASDDHYGNTDCANMNVALPFLQALKGEENDCGTLTLGRAGKKSTQVIEYNFSGDGKVSKFIFNNYMKARDFYKR
jgi:pyruvate-formate lyase